MESFKTLFCVSVLFSTYSFGYDCAEFKLQVNRAFTSSFKAHEIIKGKVGGSSKSMLANFNTLSDELPKLELYRDSIIENFSPRCVGRGASYTKETYYFKDDLQTLMTYLGDPIKERQAYIKDYMVTSGNWVNLLNRIIPEIEQRLDDISLAISNKTTTNSNLEKEKEKKLKEREDKKKALKELVDGVSVQKQANKKREEALQVTTVKSTKPVDYYTDRMASYATVIGRATACGTDPSARITQVGEWMDRWFDDLDISKAMRSAYLGIFMAGTEHHMNQQKDGKSPDTCDDAVRNQLALIN